jgi:hypothetical protein
MVQFFVRRMGRPRARFRLSIKDQRSGDSLKVELIDAPGFWGDPPSASSYGAASRRYRVRVNGRMSTKVKDLTLTEIIGRLRHWLVGRAKRSWAQRAPGTGR